jgi:N6-adenosine-specific RNA methylase IME4
MTALTVSGFTLAATGMHAEGDATFEQWQQAGDYLRYCEGAVHWWIGDWLNYGERKYGEKYAQALDTTGFDYQTVADDKWVAGKVELSRRRESLPFAHHREVASLSPEDQDELLGEAEREGLTRAKLRLRVTELKIAKQPGAGRSCIVSDLGELETSGERFGTIYADPPWQYGNQGTRAATDNHYPTMAVDEIAAMPVSRVVADNAHLHLWTTNAFLFDAERIIKAWGFEYRSTFVWCKPQMGIGNYWRVSHEFLLLGVRGEAKSFHDHSLVSWLNADRGRHSAKPEQVRLMVERASPGPRLELFGRAVVPGWTVLGNQVEKDLYSEAILSGGRDDEVARDLFNQEANGHVSGQDGEP